jgi:ribosomal protein L28
MSLTRYSWGNSVFHSFRRREDQLCSSDTTEKTKRYWTLDSQKCQLATSNNEKRSKLLKPTMALWQRLAFVSLKIFFGSIWLAMLFSYSLILLGYSLILFFIYRIWFKWRCHSNLPTVVWFPVGIAFLVLELAFPGSLWLWLSSDLEPC